MPGITDTWINQPFNHSLLLLVLSGIKIRNIFIFSFILIVNKNGTQLHSYFWTLYHISWPTMRVPIEGFEKVMSLSLFLILVKLNNRFYSGSTWPAFKFWFLQGTLLNVRYFLYTRKYKIIILHAWLIETNTSMAFSLRGYPKWNILFFCYYYYQTCLNTNTYNENDKIGHT